MFDYRTNPTPIERLNSTGFDWFLVRFRSIDYAGLNETYVSISLKAMSDEAILPATCNAMKVALPVEKTIAHVTPHFHNKMLHCKLQEK